MDENAIRQWLIDCFGPIQGEMAWNQLSNLPEELREQLMSRDPSELPKPSEVQSMMQAFTAGGLNTMGDMERIAQEGPINVKLAKSLALQQANGNGSEGSVSAEYGEMARRAISEANLWLDTACEFNPAEGETKVLTRTDWVNGTLDSWAQFASPVAQSMNDALASILSSRFGDDDGIQPEVSGIFAGPVQIPIPDSMKDPAQLMRFVGNTSFAMQLGRAAGDLSHEVRGSFDQGIALLKNPAGGLIVQNIVEYAESLELDANEVMGYLALQELAHTRLYASVPWLMPRFEALLGKYARGIAIDMDAMEEQIRDAQTVDPDSMADAVNITKVAFPDTPEQKQAMASLETLLALVEGWVDAVVWRAGMAHIPHIEQLREMLRRERAIGGPAERTFESLMGMQLRPKRMREAASLWEGITAKEGPEARDAKWSHPDLLPQLPDDGAKAGKAEGPQQTTSQESADKTRQQDAPATVADDSSATETEGLQDIPDHIDWDAELTKLLDEEGHGDGPSDGGADTSGDDATAPNGSASDDGSDAPDTKPNNESGDDPDSPEEA
ncbi:zinc-dependent metalloprotease [uncultured Bifidobacterium sp.]|uniref:zinc-dependent metalloprotease n=2 Tax=Bifidobacterium TaxID=1678 RepID=UPI0026106A82|nr:zinc-dependent metalloprotease [uncultured Bifidobacterium sp.]